MRSLVVGLVLAVTPAPVPTSIDSYLAAALDSTGLPGISVVVTHGDKVVHATGVGRDSAGSPVTAHTPMRIASVSKSFTAAAVLTLAETGRLGLDDEVARRLPGFPDKITVRQLLNQTSGLSDSSVDIGALTETRTLAEYVAALSPTPSAAPGTEWAYSNVNYDVAARLVEVVSGQPFDEYVRDAVFGPLNMRASTVGGDAADGYNSLFGLWFSRPEPAAGPRVNGAGAVVTMAADMGEWLKAQLGHGPFADSMLTTMHEPSAVDDYAMGWAPDDNGLLTHGGNLWTYNATEAIDPSRDYGYAVMTNSAGMYDDTADILAGLVALTRGETPVVPGGDRQLFDLVLALLTVLALALGALGVIRANRWTTKTAKRKSRNGEKAAPTHSRGRPAMPVYRHTPVGAGVHGAPVDNSVGCGQLRHDEPAGSEPGRADRKRAGANSATGPAGKARLLRLLWLLLPALLFALYPEVVSFVSAGRTVLWSQLFYFALPLTITLAAAAFAGLAVLVARLRSVR